VKRRIERLERLGVIRGYTLQVDHEKLEGSVEAFTELRFMGNTDISVIVAIASEIPEVQEVFTTAGDPDALREVVDGQTAAILLEPAARNTAPACGLAAFLIERENPEAVLGAQAAQVLQITHVTGHLLIDLGNMWFSVVGILRPILLDSTLDSNVYISLPVAERMFHVRANPSEIYLRANVNHVGGVSGLLAPTADPQQPEGVNVSRPSDALEARAAAKGQFTTLLLGLGGVALLVAAAVVADRTAVDMVVETARRAGRRTTIAPAAERVERGPEPHRLLGQLVLRVPGS
jgi:putative ABC transport system permease protein